MTGWNFRRSVPSEAGKRTIGWRWWCCAALLLLAAGSLTLLSGRFVFGEGHAQRPIPEFLLVLGVGWLGFLGAIRLLLRGDRPPLPFVVAVAVLARVVLIPSNLIQENDVYRYVLDGNLLVRGQNPFEWSPLDRVSRSSAALQTDLTSPEAQEVLSRIGYPDIPTVYPPAAQGVFALGALVGGWSWKGQRAVFLLLDLLVMILITMLLSKLERAPQWLVLYAWNPLVLKEIANSAHFDVLVAFAVMLSLTGLSAYVKRPSAVSAISAGAGLVLATLSKFYPMVLVPTALVLLARFGRAPHIAWFTGVFLIGTLAGWLPFLQIGLESVSRGLRIYAEVWKMNEGAYGLLELCAPAPRIIASLLIVTAAWVVPWRRVREQAFTPVVESTTWVLLVWFLWIPTPFPWYAVPLLATATLSPRFTAVCAVLTAALPAYYLHFFIEYRNYPDLWWTVSRIIEHGLIWGVVLRGVLRRNH